MLNEKTIFILSHSFVPAGKILILGAFGVALTKVASEGAYQRLEASFIAVSIGFLALMFFEPFLRGIYSLGASLNHYVSSLGDHKELLEILSDGTKRVKEVNLKNNPGGKDSLKDIVFGFSHIFKYGIWGSIRSIVEFLFLIAGSILEVSHGVLAGLVATLFPISAGLYPIFPKIMLAMILFSFELAFWIPVLTLIKILTSKISISFLSSTDLGEATFALIAVQCVSIMLMFKIPGITHAFFKGALSGDLDSSTQIAQKGRNYVKQFVIPIGRLFKS